MTSLTRRLQKYLEDRERRTVSVQVAHKATETVSDLPIFIYNSKHCSAKHSKPIKNEMDLHYKKLKKGIIIKPEELRHQTVLEEREGNKKSTGGPPMNENRQQRPTSYIVDSGPMCHICMQPFVTKYDLKTHWKYHYWGQAHANILGLKEKVDNVLQGGGAMKNHTKKRIRNVARMKRALLRTRLQRSYSVDSITEVFDIQPQLFDADGAGVLLTTIVE